VPVLPVQKTPTPSDIDLVAIRLPGEPPRRCFAELEPNLLVECKGWFDYSRTSFFWHLEHNLDLLEEGRCLPRKLLPRKEQPHLFFLRQEVYEKGKSLFGSPNFQRVIVGPYLVAPKKSRFTLDKLLTEYEKRGVLVIDIQHIIADLFKFIQDAKRERKNKIGSQEYTKLRKNYALEFLHLIDTYFETKPKQLT
jgi:hypothetical protein